MAQTYSFLDFHCSIVGAGGSFSLGSGSANADEGITFTPDSDIDTMTIGADGNGMHSLHANKSGHITVRFLKTSPTNGLLAAMLAFQRTSGANWGQNTITGTNIATGDVITCQQVAFARVPDIEYATVGKFIEWHFNAVIMDVGLGLGL
jgi:hypothetical protein